MNQNAPWDIVALFAMAGGMLFSNSAFAQILAPYAAIFFTALVGVMWALSRRPSDHSPGHRWRGALFVSKIIGAAMIASLPLAIWVAPKLGVQQDRWLVAPIAFIIGAVGEDWKPFLIWCRDFILRWKSGTPES